MRVSARSRIARTTFTAIAFAITILVLARPARAEPHRILAGREDAIKALFGDVWGGKAGPFRLTGARVDAEKVVVFFVASGRRAELVLEHPDDIDPDASNDATFIVADRDKGLAVVGTCAPACSTTDAAPLRRAAEEVIARFSGGLFAPDARTSEVDTTPGAAGSRGPPAAPLARPGAARRGSGLGAWNASVVLLASSLALAALVVARRLRDRRPAAPWLVADMALVFGVTIAAAGLLTEPAPSNWYLEFLPATGDGRALGDRHGSGELVLELVARALVPWTDRALFAFTLVASAAGASLAYASFRALALPRATCLLAGVLTALSPMPMRAAWSGSPHAFVLVLFYAALLAWLRGQREGAWPDRVLALTLAAALPLVRVDALLFAAMPLLWGLVDVRRGPALRRRVALAALYAAVLGGVAWMTWVLVVLPSGAPVPDPGEWRTQARALLLNLELFRQFFEPSGWFPRPLAWLLVPGAVVLLGRRPRVLAAIVVTLALPQIALARAVDGEGLIGARYFLPAFPLLSLLAAAPLGPLALHARLATISGSRRRAIEIALGAVACAATVASAWPMYRYRYTYQEEYRFLREHLAGSRRPARVFHVSVHDDPALRLDPDCCLDPGKSPLVLALPGVEFEPLEIDPSSRPLPDADEPAVYYFESGVCGLGPTEATEHRNPGVARLLRERCARLAADRRLTLVASAVVPARAAWPFFATPDVTLRLFRVETER